jgi:hypothetical protein
MQHLDEGTIHSWLDGALSVDETARVEAHVKECPQCAAAVAEARGFIAASSRILTSLDNVPKGVVPTVPLSKPGSWGVWRAAAAVMIVALGSFVVLRDRTATPDQTTPVSAVALRTDTRGATEPASEPTETAAPATARKAAPIRTSEPQASIGGTPPKAPGDGGNRTTFQRVALPPAATNQLGKASSASAKARESLRGNVAASPTSEFGSSVSAQSAVSPKVTNGVMMDATEAPLRVVGTPRVIGEKRTLYEVAPGDTVLLAEETNAYLSAVVVTGDATNAQRDTAAGGAQRMQGASKMSAPQQSQRRPDLAPAVAPLSAPAVQTANGVTTVVWRDPATGNTMRLSGRHSPTELFEIRRRIERTRAAEAAKKKP